MAAVGPGRAARRAGDHRPVLARLAAFPRVDLVVLLDEGRVAEAGTHAELLAANGRYAQIYLAQQRIGQAIRLPRRTADERRRPDPGNRPARPTGGSTTYRQVVGAPGTTSRAAACGSSGWSSPSATLELVPPLMLRTQSWTITCWLVGGRSDALAMVYLVAMAAVEVTRAMAGYLTGVAAQGTLHDLRVRLFSHFSRCRSAGSIARRSARRLPTARRTSRRSRPCSRTASPTS